MAEEVLYTPEEIAERLKLSKYTVYEMIKREELPAYHVGRSLRISDAQVEIFLKSGGNKDNTYTGEIRKQDQSKHALIDDKVKICVKTDMEGKARLRIAPENVILSREPFESSARNVHKGIVTGLDERADSVMVTLDIGIPLKALVTKRALSEMGIGIGEECWATFKTMNVQVFR